MLLWKNSRDSVHTLCIVHTYIYILHKCEDEQFMYNIIHCTLVMYWWAVNRPDLADSYIASFPGRLCRGGNDSEVHIGNSVK